MDPASFDFSWCFFLFSLPVGVEDGVDSLIEGSSEGDQGVEGAEGDKVGCESDSSEVGRAKVEMTSISKKSSTWKLLGASMVFTELGR